MKTKREPCNLHHRLPKSAGGTEEPSNLAIVKVCDHRSYHNLFGTKPPEDIAAILNDRWIDPSKKLICVPENVYYELRSYLAIRRMIHFETISLATLTGTLQEA